MSSTVSENAKFNISTLPSHDVPKEPMVEDFMVKSMPCLTPEMDLFEAMKILLREETNGLPVLNSANEVIGFLSEKDCLKHAYDSKYNALPPQSVKDFMYTEVVCLEKGTEIFKAIDWFINKNYQCYPIVDNGKFIGLLYRSNALKAVHKMKDDIF